MAIKRLNKNDIIRGRIMDGIAEHFGNSVIGVYDKKLRVEIIDEETGDVIQFSVAPVVHKELVDPEDCDEYITTDEKIKLYEESLKKNTPSPKVKKSKDKVKTDSEKVVEAEFNFDEKPKAKVETPVISQAEQDNLDKIMAELDF